MNATTRAAGIMLIAVPLVFVAGFIGLQMTFDYPDILRLAAGAVLTRFAAAGGDLHFYWYAMMTAALGLIPAATAAGLVLWNRAALVAALAMVAGVLAGLVQALGLLRWVVLVPSLADAYVRQGATQIERAMAASLFDAANRYLGMGVGEHFGYLFTAGWTTLVSALVFRTHRLLAVAGLAIGLGVAIGILEPYGAPFAGVINSISYSAWALWALVFGVAMLRGGFTRTMPAEQAG